MDKRTCIYGSGTTASNYMGYGNMYLMKGGQINPVATFTPPFPYALPSYEKLGLMPPTNIAMAPDAKTTSYMCVYCKK